MSKDKSVTSSSASSPSKTPILIRFLKRKKSDDKKKPKKSRSSTSSSSLTKNYGEVYKHPKPGEPVHSVDRLSRPKTPLPIEKWPKRREDKHSTLLTDEQVEKIRGEVMEGIVYSGQFLGISRAVSEPGETNVSRVQKKMMKRYFSIVYGISSLLYGVTALIILFCIFVESVREFFADYSWIKYVFLVIYLVLSFLLSCWETLRKTVPFNYLILFPVAVSCGLFAGAVAAQYEVFSVLIGMISAMLLTLVLSAISWIIPLHLTQKPIMLTAPLIAIIALSSCTWFASYFFSIPIGQILSSGVLLVAYSIYLALTVRVIMSPGSSVLETWDIVFGVTLIYAAKAALIFHFLDFCGMLNKT